MCLRRNQKKCITSSFFHTTRNPYACTAHSQAQQRQQGQRPLHTVVVHDVHNRNHLLLYTPSYRNANCVQKRRNHERVGAFQKVGKGRRGCRRSRRRTRWVVAKHLAHPSPYFSMLTRANMLRLMHHIPHIPTRFTERVRHVCGA